MKPRSLIACFAFQLLGMVLLNPLTAAQPPVKPNIVIVFIDDMGYADIGPFGSTKQNTPHLDRMAREGMKLTSFYAAPVCSVSRAQLLTGCYGARISVPAVYFPSGPQGLNPAEFTIAERLKEQGYATSCIGKWHVGDQPEFLPTRQGFDHYFGIPYSNDMLKTSAATGKNVVPLLRDEKVVELLTEEAQSQIVEKYTEEAVGFIRDHKDKPFFLYLPHNAIHTPIHPGEKFRGKSANGRFGDWVEEVDASTGRILDTLRELKIDDRTLVVFTSDNGPWLIKGPDGGSAKPLRGGKGSTWEGGVRVPTIAWWPGKIAPGSSNAAVAGTIDLLPTAVALAGGKLPAEPVLDGRDISPLLLGKSQESPREAHYYFSGYELQAVRQGPWKLALVPQPESMFQKLAPDVEKNAMRLYNLEEEIGEQTNLAEKNPAMVAKLQGLAAKMGAEIAGKNPSARRPAGVVSNPQPLYPFAEKPAKPAEKPPAAVLEKLKLGETVNSSEAPQIAGKSFTIRCTIETKQRDAVILAHGGTFYGYALTLKGGKPAFLVRTGANDSFTEIVAANSLAGKVDLTAALAADGTLSLQLNDEPAVTAKGEKLIPTQPMEDFSLGFDSGNPVGKYSGKEMFQGTITGVKVEVK